MVGVGFVVSVIGGGRIFTIDLVHREHRSVVFNAVNLQRSDSVGIEGTIAAVSIETP